LDAATLKNISGWLSQAQRFEEASMFYNNYFWGMHAYWWFFWVFLWILFFSFLMPVRRASYQVMQSPLQLLQKRYAAGEITKEEYEERRSVLMRDANTK